LSSEAGSLVDLRREGDVAVLTLRREEKLNAISTAVERALLDALGGDEVAGSGALVITGSGRAFSAGFDVSEVAAGAEEALAYFRATGDVYERVGALPQPTFAAIHGYCLGGGLELALAADFRIADSTAVFGLPEVGLGIPPSSGGLHRLVRLVGAGRAKELMLLRSRFTPEEAASFGVVTELVPEGQALPRALELAAHVASLPRLAVSIVKEAANILPDASRDASLLIERLAYAALAETEDAREAARAWAERRRDS
jgi:enoyl-CoA hydratase/carnithine racemase